MISFAGQCALYGGLTAPKATYFSMISFFQVQALQKALFKLAFGVKPVTNNFCLHYVVFVKALSYK